MKKLAARDFEDILQVSTLQPFPPGSLLRLVPSTVTSVGSQSSKVSFQMVNTTRFYLTSPSTWQHGMHMQNFGSTLPTPSTPFGRRQRSSAVNSVVMPTNCVLSTRQNRSQERLPPPIVVELQKLRRLRPLLKIPNRQERHLSHLKVHPLNSSTLKPTSFMRWVITQITLSVSAQQTALQHNRSVCLPLGLPMPFLMTRHMQIRASLSIDVSKSFTNAPTRSGLSDRLRDMNEWNVTTASTLMH